MGVAFNFNCTGVGLYMCSRCGFELFDTDDKIRKHDLPYPISFTKGITTNSVIPILDITPQPITSLARRSPRTQSPEEILPSATPIPVACGRCGIRIGVEIPTDEGHTYFDIEWKSLLFVRRRGGCGVPWSFIL